MKMTDDSYVSINKRTNPLVKDLLADASALNLIVTEHESGAMIVDAGIQAVGGLEAGRRVAEICMGGLGSVSLQNDSTFKNWSLSVKVHAKSPVIACLGSQYAGWALSHDKFFSLGSGPARAIAQREDIYKELAYTDHCANTCLVLETDRVPPIEVIEKVAHDTRIRPANLTFILTPTRSIAGTVQITARVLEVALHKLHAVHFPLDQFVDGYGVAPIPAPSPDFLTGMGRTNDAILFGGFVHLYVQCEDVAAAELSQAMPSSASKDYGRPF
ncbi:MAG TPA: methenyltetrahydromethanopterin cyclohydrolase, partial [Methylophilaceae bacterium]|nr:methenyltetrahydromethanopterin cyclohydrolase [Methylophilaceae bacterium]